MGRPEFGFGFSAELKAISALSYTRIAASEIAL